MTRPASDVAFSAAVKAEQARHGSRVQYERMEPAGGWPDAITPDLAAVLQRARSIYFGTASADGQPYIQHRGGAPGFLKVLDEGTIGFADLVGNRQYVTVGNLTENSRAIIFFMDYEQRLRIKIWGQARIVENDDELLSRLRPPVGTFNAERSILFSVHAWDRNCRQHIPQLFPIEKVEAALLPLRQRIQELEEELQRLRSSR